MKAAERFEEITAQIIKSIEDGIANPNGWKAPWHGAGLLPSNATTKVAYRGGNVIALWMEQARAGYATAWWATYKQWESVGAQVRGGEKGTYGIKWVTTKPKKDDPDARPGMFPSVFSLFNAAQVDGWEMPEPATGPERDDAADRFFAQVGADVDYAPGNSPAYWPAADRILMPVCEQFISTDGFYSTLAHEHTHWSGAPSRLDRDLSTRFGSEAYAAEELVAELGAAFLSAHLGVSAEPRPDHAHYLANWLEVLQGDPRALYAAATKAQDAADFLIKAGDPAAAVAEEEVAVS